jgi:hypothetical protein
MSRRFEVASTSRGVDTNERQDIAMNRIFHAVPILLHRHNTVSRNTSRGSTFTLAFAQNVRLSERYGTYGQSHLSIHTSCRDVRLQSV